MTTMVYGQSSKHDYNEDNNSNSSLFKHSIELCDFCDKVFNNRYSHLVHNSKHIIIPLLKQKLLQCKECLFCFLSQDDLNDHKVKKHTQMMPLLQALKSECRVNVERMVDNKEVLRCNKKEAEIVPVTIISPDEVQTLGEGKPLVEYTETSGLKNRIVFEDQDEDMISQNANYLLDDLTIDCKVDVEMFVTPCLHNSDNQKYQALMNDGEFNQNGLPNVPENYTSVHYDDLVAPGEFHCKFCRKIYLNRFQLIKHETKHIYLKRPRSFLCPHCDWFVGRNYRTLHRHIDEKHSNTCVDIKLLQKTCRQCGLKYYNYTQHKNNYHNYECNVIDEKNSFNGNKDSYTSDESVVNEVFTKMYDHKKPWASREIKVCEMCFSFLKNKQNVLYVHLRDINVLGMRQMCEKCGHNFFEVKLVRLYQAPSVRHFYDRKKRPISNKDRLKNIRLRLKMINKLNK